MIKNKRVLMITLVCLAIAIQGWAFLAQPKVFTVKHVTHNDIVQSMVHSPRSTAFEPQEIEVKQAVEKENSELELLGTAIGNVKDPIAFIKDLETSKQGIYRLGSIVKGAEVIKIVLGEVVLSKDGKQETLKMSKRARAWAKLDSSTIISKSNDIFTVSRSGLLKEAQTILNTLPTLKFKPYLEGRKATGLMVEGIAEGSIVKEAGIQNRDIIKSVNGQTINSYQQALQVASKMRGQSEIKVSILRDGKLQNLSFQFVR